MRSRQEVCFFLLNLICICQNKCFNLISGTLCVSGESFPAAMESKDMRKIPITVGKAHSHDKECEDAEQANDDMVAEGGHKDETVP